MDLLFNTIMLEPNRWTPDKHLSRPLEDLLAPLHAAGFHQLEIWQYHISTLADHEIDNLRAALAARDMTVVAVGAYPHLDGEGTTALQHAEELARVVEISAALGSSILKIFPGRVASGDVDAHVLAQSLRRLRQLATDVGDHGMVLTLETHGGTLCDNRDSTMRLLAQLEDVDNLALCFQPYVDDDTQATIAFYDSVAHHVHHLHLQNRRGTQRTTTRLEEGDWIDFGHFLPHLRNNGFDGVACIEFTADITPPEGESFDLAKVIDNAVADARFVEQVWRG